jgi:hypothetical protein
MKYRLLGKSGLRVSEAALGTTTFGDEWGWGSPKAEVRQGTIFGTMKRETRIPTCRRSIRKREQPVMSDRAKPLLLSYPLRD